MDVIFIFKVVYLFKFKNQFCRLQLICAVEVIYIQYFLSTQHNSFFSHVYYLSKTEFKIFILFNLKKYTSPPPKGPDGNVRT